jgi:hypothetical protein
VADAVRLNQRRSEKWREKAAITPVPRANASRQLRLPAAQRDEIEQGSKITLGQSAHRWDPIAIRRQNAVSGIRQHRAVVAFGRGDFVGRSEPNSADGLRDSPPHPGSEVVIHRAVHIGWAVK